MNRFALVFAALLGALVVWTAPARAATFHDLGRAPVSLPVRLAITLRYRHAAELDALVQAQADPRSPYFRHYLTNAQFAAYFAPAPQDYARVTGMLRNAGLTVLPGFANRTIVDAVGPSAAIERLFQTEIHAGVQDGNGVRYANVRAPVIPAAVRDLVATVSGLDDLISFAPRLRLAPAPAAPDIAGPPLGGPKGGLGPLDFIRGYDEPVQHGFDGTGRSIANVIAGNIRDDDLNAFLKYFQIKAAHPLRRITVNGGKLGSTDVETTLDIEAMSSTAPGAQVYLYSFPEFTDADAEDAYNKIVDDDLVDAANSSWGGCETSIHALGHAFSIASNMIFEQGASKGITFSVATGDSGWTTCRHGGTISETTPDSDPYALAVGGTTLNLDANGDWAHETAWGGSSGGISVVFPSPSYQRGVRNAVRAGRDIPDIALDADPFTGMALLWHGHWGVVGGTSMASPLWVGLEGQIDQYIHGRAGFVNPQLYAILGGKSYRSIFHDIVKGDNGGYRAVRGYDLVTGIGSPIGWPLAQALRTGTSQ